MGSAPEGRPRVETGCVEAGVGDDSTPNTSTSKTKTRKYDEAFLAPSFSVHYQGRCKERPQWIYWRMTCEGLRQPTWCHTDMLMSME